MKSLNIFQIENSNFHLKKCVSHEYKLNENYTRQVNVDCNNIQYNQLLKQICQKAHPKTNDHLLGYADLKLKLDNSMNEIGRLRCNQLNLARYHLRHLRL